MSEHATKQEESSERLTLGEGARSLFVGAAAAAVIGLAATVALGYGKSNGFQPFWFAYLSAYAFFLSIVLGATLFVLAQHLTRAGWSVGVRRIAENLMGLMPWMAILAIPLLISVATQKGDLYRWALPINPQTAPQRVLDAAAKGESDEAPEATQTPSAHENETSSFQQPPRTLDSVTLQKRLYGIHWLDPWWFIARVALYLAILVWIAGFFRGRSLQQDQTKDPRITRSLQAWSGICTVVALLVLTGIAGDLFMSLDPHWYSTMWGFYYFAACMLAIFSTLILISWLLQRAGYLRHTINREHYHDLGKYLFGFTFFWGYIAFSQYMLLWYANIPEEIEWFSRHGATTVSLNVNGWAYVMVAILFGQLLIPFGFLMSRHVKRAVTPLILGAVWVLAFHALDMIWIVMPEYPGKFDGKMVVLTAAAFVGMGGLLTALFVRSCVGRNLRPTADPRLAESLAFQNV